MPLTATQKPKRNEIKQLARRLIDDAQGDELADAKVFDLRDRKKKAK